MTNPVATVVLLLTGVTALALAARRLPVPYPTVMVVAGAAAGWVPGLPAVEFDSETALLVFLPPLLYAAAWRLPWRDFRADLRPIALLAVGLVLATTLAVAALSRAWVPDMPWAVALALGALVAPPDAVAVAAVTRRLPLPRRLAAVIEGESLVNDATGLVLYRAAVAAAVTGAFSPAAGARLALAPAGGVLVGLATGWLAVRVHRRLEDPTLESVVSLLTPFAAYLPAEAAGASGVLATVAAGMYVASHAAALSPAARLHAAAAWDVLVFLLSGLAFVLIGLQIPEVLAAAARRPAGEVVGLTGLVCLAVVAVRLLWVFPAAHVPRLLSRRLRARDPVPPAGALAVLGWAGARGVVTVAAALALPRLAADGRPLPHRDLLVLVAFAVVLFTLVVQGQTLPALIRRLGVSAGADEQARAEAGARREVLSAAVAYLDAATARGDAGDGAAHLRERYGRRLAAALSPTGSADPGSGAGSAGRLHLAVLAEQRRALAVLGARGAVTLEVYRRIEREIDLEEARVAESMAGPPAGRA